MRGPNLLLEVLMHKITKALAASLLLGLGSNVPAADTDEERQIRNDCRTEGQAAGLAGKELEEFIESCVAELLSAELINVVK